MDTGTEPESAQRVADEVYMQEYAALKEEMLDLSRKAGGALAAYLAFALDGPAALCALLGSAGGQLYLRLVIADVDRLGPDSYVPMDAAYQVENPMTRAVAKVVAGYIHGLPPRLLVPVALAAVTAGLNQVLDPPLDLAHQGCVLLGFLSYKAPLFARVAADNAPKGYKDEEMSRPMIAKIADDDLDQWGRPRKSLYKMPTEALPETVDTSMFGKIDLEGISSFEDAMKVLRDASLSGAAQGEAPGDSQTAPNSQSGAADSPGDGGGIRRRDVRR